jgi:hypothetical protein
VFKVLINGITMLAHAVKMNSARMFTFASPDEKCPAFAGIGIFS